MTTLQTNRFLTKALRILCCAGALTACSAWATVVTWQWSASGNLGATKNLSKSGFAITAWGVDQTSVTDASHQFLFKAAPESGAGETNAGLARTLNNKPQTTDTNIRQERAALFQGGGQNSAGGTQSDESLQFAASNTVARPTTELDDAMARTFDEEFVSVPTVQFAAMAAGLRDISVASVAIANVDPAPVPEMSALFPIVGLIAAVSCTQILRRRRAAQLSASRSVV